MFTEIFAKQRNYHEQGGTRKVDIRINNLLKLKKAIQENEDKLMAGMKQNLNKSYEESLISEFFPFYQEINHTIKNIKKWSQVERKKGSLLSPFSKYRVYKEAKGQVLIVSPFNYPVLLALLPLLSALAAGNTVILKLSELTESTSQALMEIINETFTEELVYATKVGQDDFADLFDLPYNHIFFTGSMKVGRIILKKGADNLIPVTLELGGKSPCIVDGSGNLNEAVKKIVFAKLLNSGQTCVAPDYILLQEKSKEEFLRLLKEEFERAYGILKERGAFLSLINIQHFKRVVNYLEGENIYYGGGYNEESLRVDPALILVEDLNIPLMEEEIFAPVLPVVIYRDYEDILKVIAKNKNPLALYIFSDDKDFINRIIKDIPFGGGAVNEVLIQLLNSHVPFGGRDFSGMGRYHGKYGYETFSHLKTVAAASPWFHFKVKYPPYKERIIKFSKKFYR